MTVEEIVKRVGDEKLIPGRFPARLIFVRNFNEYTVLANDLRDVCDIVLDIADYTKGDTLPRFKDLKAELSKYNEKQFLLLSFGEYLRICAKWERNKKTCVFPGIWEQIQREASITKYIIPIFGGREIFDQIMPYPNERQQMFIMEASAAAMETEYTITVYSPNFLSAVKPDATNLQEWLMKWHTLYADKNKHSFSLITKLYRYTDNIFGSLKIRVVDDIFTHVTALITDGDNLKREYGDDQFWIKTAEYAIKGRLMSETIKYVLNVGHTFEPVHILSGFSGYNEYQKQMLWLWYKLYPAGDYYSYAIGGAVNAFSIPLALRDDIIKIKDASDDFIKQRIAVLSVMDISYDDTYFAKLDKTYLPEMRLRMLTYKTHIERAYAIKTVSDMLRKGVDLSGIVELIEHGYPDLAHYLRPTNNVQGDIAAYFNWYCRSKIINRPNADVPCEIDFSRFDNRNKFIQQNKRDDTLLFWVDGLGAEWLPLLIYKLQVFEMGVEITFRIAKTSLPSETEYNHEWSKDDEKWDRLDKLSHNGMPDDKNYFSCIVKQFDIIGEIAAHISVLISSANRVIITSDHGSSRLAALLFHDKENFAIEQPKDCDICSFGRYVKLKNGVAPLLTPSMEYVKRDEQAFIVLKTYEHFIQKGNAAGSNTDENAIVGEVHGGMTPEEHLVPVIIITRKTPLKEQSDPMRQSVIPKPKGINANEMGMP